MSLLGRPRYYDRVFSAYFGSGKSQLTFWHDTPRANQNAPLTNLGEYYMDFSQKADYAGPLDEAGIPMLDYGGQIGLQYNPLAVAQWGLGNHLLFRRTGEEVRKAKFLAASDWLIANLEQNSFGHWVWNHHFDWEYRTRLRAPWYSGLAQGQGISLLVRAYTETGQAEYLHAADRAFASFLNPTDKGGVSFTDQQRDLWFEEYIVDPPTHILNGFIWAMWGVYDYFLATGKSVAEQLFARAVRTLARNLERFDLGFWSLYEQSGTRLPMVASPFHHRLHIVQLGIMHRITGDPAFSERAARWEAYSRSRVKRIRALCYEAVFKLCYY